MNRGSLARELEAEAGFAGALLEHEVPARVAIDAFDFVDLFLLVGPACASASAAKLLLARIMVKNKAT